MNRFFLCFPLILLFVWHGHGISIACERESGTTADRKTDRLPHIVFILADDLGYGDLSCYNPDSRIETTHLDRLARSGLRFTDAHSGGSSCITSRYSLLTGRFALRMGKGPALIKKNDVTIASMLKQQGYATAMVGKWHLGFDRHQKQFDYSQPFTDGPLDRGFDSFFGMHASLDIPPYFYLRGRSVVSAPNFEIEARSSVGTNENWNHIQGEFWRKGKISNDFRHDDVTPRFFKESTDVIRAHAQNNGFDQPLFLYVALPSPHTPWLPQSQFRGRSGAGMYGDFVLQVDAGVGQILNALEAHGMSKNSIVIFSSDNGPVWYEKDVTRFGHRSVGPLKGMKFSSHEGGHRMPFIVRWPKKIERNQTSSQTIAFADLFSTLAELTGYKAESRSIANDRVSFLPNLLNPSANPTKRPPIIHDRRTIRSGDWKLILPRQNKAQKNSSGNQSQLLGELYNLSKDITEQNNLWKKHPERVKQLRQILASYLDSVNSNRK